MPQEIDYTAVLADLEARRASIDAAILGVRALLGQVAAENGGGGEFRIEQGSVTEAGEIKPGTFHGLSVADAAKKFLEMTKTKQRTKDIVEAIQRGGIESTAGNFYSNVYTTLMRRKDFKRLGKYWVLVEWNPNVSPVVEKPTKAKKRGKSKRRSKSPASGAVSATSETAETKT